MDAFLLGMTPVGLRCRDASRLVDFPETQEPVDRKWIGVAGLSDVGPTGLFLIALEPRIGLAMIGDYYCTYRDSIFCICNCVPDLMRWCEMREIAAVFAPKPVDHRGHSTRDLPIAATKALSGSWPRSTNCSACPAISTAASSTARTPGTIARRSRSSAATGAGCDQFSFR